jgi:mannosyltransferase OCH1-like enzyme
MNIIINRNQTSKYNQIVNNQMLKIYTRPYKLKNKYNSIIPLNIFQTWYTKDLPPKMKEYVELLKSQHPRFKHFLFDDNDCREFIKNNFNPEVLHAYDTLIPGAYKADLWRYCVLYIHGGIYMDIKLRCINQFKLIELTEQNHLVKDRPLPLSIFNALMVSQKGNPLLLQAIQRIVLNVKNKFYGSTPLDPTGPLLLGKIILNNRIRQPIDLYHYSQGGYIIFKNKFIISTEYPEYNKERGQLHNKTKTKYYAQSWNDRHIYK